MKNLWLGVPLSEEQKRVLETTADRVKAVLGDDMKQFSPTVLHMTFFFFGKHLKRSEYDQIADWLEKNPIQTEIRTERLNLLSSHVVVKFKPTKQLLEYHRRLGEYVERFGYKAYDFIPHVSLGRLTVKRRDVDSYQLKINLKEDEMFDLSVESVELQGDVERLGLKN